MNPHTRRLLTVKHGSQHYWRIIQQFNGRDFTVADVHARTRQVKRDAVSRYVTYIARLGYLEVVAKRAVSPGRIPAYVYRCIRPGVPAPVLHEASYTGVYGQRHRNLWTAMRQLREFNLLELSAAASTEEVQVARNFAAMYVRALRKAGLVIVLRKPTFVFGRGVVSPATYFLKPEANTGPAPYEVHGGTRLYDPNRRRWYDLAEVPA